MPGAANELSTLEWHTAHWSPTDFRLPLGLKKPVTPSTELSFIRASITAGSLRSTWPDSGAGTTEAGGARGSFLVQLPQRSQDSIRVLPRPTCSLRWRGGA